MFRKFMLLTVAAIIMLQTDNALAQGAGRSGLLGGAAGGAILGQAIGRDTEGTLLGTAIGGVLGYIIGNEMDKQGQPTSRPIYTSLPPAVYDAPGQRPPRYAVEHLCRPAEILATIDGYPERVNTIACLEGDEWVIQGTGGNSFERTVIIEQDNSYWHKNQHHFRGRHAGNGRGCKKSSGAHHFRDVPPAFAGRDNVRIVIY